MAICRSRSPSVLHIFLHSSPTYAASVTAGGPVIEIVILWGYYTIPFWLSLCNTFTHPQINCLINAFIIMPVNMCFTQMLSNNFDSSIESCTICLIETTSSLIGLLQLSNTWVWSWKQNAVSRSFLLHSDTLLYMCTCSILWSIKVITFYIQPLLISAYTNMPHCFRCTSVILKLMRVIEYLVNHDT